MEKTAHIRKAGSSVSLAASGRTHPGISESLISFSTDDRELGRWQMWPPMDIADGNAIVEPIKSFLMMLILLLEQLLCIKRKSGKAKKISWASWAGTSSARQGKAAALQRLTAGNT